LFFYETNVEKHISAGPKWANAVVHGGDVDLCGDGAAKKLFGRGFVCPKARGPERPNEYHLWQDIQQGE
jgi:hypothetical protein